jgi:hypothetical protein
MRTLPRAFCWIVLLTTFNVATAFAQETEKEIEGWIDQLIGVSEPGFGYSLYFAGSEFLPYEGSGEVGMLVLGTPPAKHSETLRKIVEKGATAVPLLLKHIGDARPIKMEPLKGMMWMSFDDEYDFNRRTRKTPPPSVNRNFLESNAKQPDRHAVTVGDLCFVALGQIVNRQFSATRYQPTGGLIINSPTYSEKLKKVILDDWGGLDKQKHKKSLIDDSQQPDSESRLVGAYLRLAFYYPEVVEPLVLKQLGEPLYNAIETQNFVRNQLYFAHEAERRKKLFDAFIATNGEAARQGILHDLFDDLDQQEADEQGRLHPPLKEKFQARACLIELFGYPKEVKNTDCPSNLVVDECTQARFIESLTHDKSKKIGDEVRKLFLQHEKHDYFAPACLTCLASRGYGAFLIEQLNKINVADPQTNKLHLKFIEAISRSQDPDVKAELLEIVKTTKNDAYFMAALPAVDKSQNELILTLARNLLANLPEDTSEGQDLLAMIGERFPDQAKKIYRSFLAKGSAKRAATMCVVLWYGNPMAKEILAPLLEDKRILSGFTIPMRVCDRAATAISQASGTIKFDAEWPLKEKDHQIELLKKYCRKSDKTRSPEERN